MSCTVLLSMNSNRKAGFLTRNLSCQSSLLHGRCIISLQKFHTVSDKGFRIVFCTESFRRSDSLYKLQKRAGLIACLKVIRS